MPKSLEKRVRVRPVVYNGEAKSFRVTCARGNQVSVNVSTGSRGPEACLYCPFGNEHCMAIKPKQNGDAYISGGNLKVSATIVCFNEGDV